jgi:hypothetical protein
VDNLRGIALILVGILSLSCSPSSLDIPSDPESDFQLSCLHWNSTITICEDHIETDSISGYFRVESYHDDPIWGTVLFVCGADLESSTGHPFKDMIADSATKGELVCIDAAQAKLEYDHNLPSYISAAWGDVSISIDIRECQYDQDICAAKGFGYLSLDDKKGS